MRSARVGTVSHVIPNPDREVAVTDEQRDSISLQKRSACSHANSVHSGHTESHDRRSPITRDRPFIPPPHTPERDPNSKAIFPNFQKSLPYQ